MVHTFVAFLVATSSGCFEAVTSSRMSALGLKQTLDVSRTSITNGPISSERVLVDLAVEEVDVGEENLMLSFVLRGG